jgi:hypothetical protein
MFLARINETKQTGGRVALVGLRGDVEQELTACNVPVVFPHYMTTGYALAAFSAPHEERTE